MGVDLYPSIWRRFTLRSKEYRQHLLPQPYSGHSGLEVLHLFLVAFFQFVMIPSLIPWSQFRVDLLTPWMLVYIVMAPYSNALVMCLLAALLQEGFRLIPAGTYICVYFVMCNVLFLIRQLVSWRQIQAWYVALIVAQAWASGFELLVFYISHPSTVLPSEILLATAIKFGLSMLASLFLAHWAVNRLHRQSS